MPTTEWNRTFLAKKDEEFLQEYKSRTLQFFPHNQNPKYKACYDIQIYHKKRKESK